MMDMRKLKKLLYWLVSTLYITSLYYLYHITGDPELSFTDPGFHRELHAMWPQLNFSDIDLHTWLQLTNQYFQEALRIDSEPFVVQTSTCKIPNHNPTDRSLWGVVRPLTSVSCGERAPLSSVRKVGDRHQLVVDSSPAVVGQYVSRVGDLSCCYSTITRVVTPAGQRYDTQADSRYKYDTAACTPCTHGCRRTATARQYLRIVLASCSMSKCKYFQWETTLDVETEFIYVKCFSRVIFWMDVEKYSAMHAIVPSKPEVHKRLQEYEQSEGAKRNALATRANVILLGIDSCSRLNLLRTMPRTVSLLQQDGWFEMQGYLKVGANTLPNFMALLAGLRGKNSFGQCMPEPFSKMDDCPFLWKEFARRGYATALAEDEPFLGSFNHEKTGFVRQPTDHYFRPFMLSAHENLPARLRRNILTVCLGHVQTTEYILRYLDDFTTSYANHPFFGIFWLNNFSHENPNDVAAQDERFTEFFSGLRGRGTLNNTIMLFFSDHGTRFGPLRETSIGWFEDRMPFVHIWLPPWFRDKYPERVDNLRRNSNRLTSPFDLHATFNEVLRMQEAARGAPGVSLFGEVPENRTCFDAGIDDEWCACVRHEELSAEDPVGVQVARFAVEQMQALLDQRSEHLCARLSLNQVKKLSWRQERERGDFVEYLVEFETTPGRGLFEATVRRARHALSLSGNIKRVNRYGSQSACTHDLSLKEFCYCL